MTYKMTTRIIPKFVGMILINILDIFELSIHRQSFVLAMPPTFFTLTG